MGRLDEIDHDDADLTPEDQDFLDDLDAMQDGDDLPDADEFYELEDEEWDDEDEI